MIELLIVLILAAVGLLVISRAFSTTSTGTEKTQKAAVKAAKKEKAAVSVPKEKIIAEFAPEQPKKSNSVPKKRPLTKKQKAAKAAEEAEMDRIIAASAKSTKGMGTDKSKVISLESVKKQDNTQSNKKAQEVEVTTKQRLIEAEEGFAIVEKKKERGTSQKYNKAKAKKVEEAKKDDKLTDFFKKQDKKGKTGGYKGKFDDKDNEPKTGGNVTMRKKISSEAKDMWNERKYE